MIRVGSDIQHIILFSAPFRILAKIAEQYPDLMGIVYPFIFREPAGYSRLHLITARHPGSGVFARFSGRKIRPA
ncbi:hypothetical protein A7X67_09715 [Clostridium sp. W14A]|nr:hypothetical protein A7X67_09715 [Clostridium sp. W14A]